MGEGKTLPLLGGLAFLLLPLLLVVTLLCTALGAGSSHADPCSSTDSLVGSKNQQKAFNYFASNGYSKEQAAGIVGNLIHESSVEPMLKEGSLSGTRTSASEVDRPGSVDDWAGGWGIVQWTPASKVITASRRLGIKDEQIESLDYQLGFLKKQLDGDGPVPEGRAGQELKATRSPEDAAFAFGRWYERFQGSENPDHERYAQRRTAARQVFTTFAEVVLPLAVPVVAQSGAAIGATPGAAAGAGAGAGAGAAGLGGCGAGDGDVVRTALSLAWDTSGHGKLQGDAKPEYQAAMPKFNGATAIDPYSDCGVFVATVMVMSGVDKGYVRRVASSQREYVRSSPKYQTFENLDNVSQLQPGDIFVHDGHTFVYTGNYQGGDGKTYNAASASLHGHVPEATTVYFSDARGHYTVARIKK
ncbi:MAG: hypothetical protein QOF10_585 [Kribbellaceae bacterium]|nr:hypothetical protein [Kribbellaceae bacterium]